MMIPITEEAVDEILTKKNLKNFIQKYEKEIKEQNWTGIVQKCGDYGTADLAMLKAIFSDILKENLLLKISYIPTNLFKGDKTLTTLEIPSNITRISSEAFKDCSNLESCLMPDSVTEIGEDLFSGCSKLKDVKLSEKLSDIPTNTFKDCSSLKYLSIPDSVKTMGYSVFKGCPDDAVIEITRGVDRSLGPDDTNPKGLKIKTSTYEYIKDHVKWRLANGSGQEEKK